MYVACTLDPRGLLPPSAALQAGRGRHAGLGITQRRRFALGSLARARNGPATASLPHFHVKFVNPRIIGSTGRARESDEECTNHCIAATWPGARAGGCVMKAMRWRRFSSAALAAAIVVGGAVGAGQAAPQSAEQAPAKGAEQTIVLREHGKPDRVCIIEKSTPQPDGTVLHEVRDSASGERMRVLDQRKNKSSIGSVMARVSGPNALDVAAATKQDPGRVPTNAELAGQPKAPASPY